MSVSRAVGTFKGDICQIAQQLLMEPKSPTSGTFITDVISGASDAILLNQMFQMKANVQIAKTGRTGRPIGFNRDKALEAAMLLFWERGYEGTSMADLTHATGLNASSLYAAFGDKHALFTHSVTRYLETRTQYATLALERPTLKTVIRALFENTVVFLSAPDHPPSCMTLGGAMGCGSSAAPAKDLMTEIRRQNEVAMKQRFIKARNAGEFPADINLDDFTRYISMMLAGLSIQAANGSTKAELKRTADLALQYLKF